MIQKYRGGVIEPPSDLPDYFYFFSISISDFFSHFRFTLLPFNLDICEVAGSRICLWHIAQSFGVKAMKGSEP